MNKVKIQFETGDYISMYVELIDGVRSVMADRCISSKVKLQRLHFLMGATAIGALVFIQNAPRESFEKESIHIVNGIANNLILLSKPVFVDNATRDEILQKVQSFLNEIDKYQALSTEERDRIAQQQLDAATAA